MKALKLFVAFLNRIVKTINNFIHTLEAKIKKMETEVKSDISGLTKTATLNSLSFDANGGFQLNISFGYKDPNGNVLNFADASKASVTISGTAPDPSKTADQLTPEDQANQATYSAIVAALSPVVKSIVPDAV